MKLKILSETYALLNAAQRKKGLFIVSLLVLQSLLDFFSLASFLPLIFLIVNPDLISTNYYLKSFNDYLGFTSLVSLIIFMTIAVLLFTIVKNLISVRIAKAKAGYAFGVGANLSARAVEWSLERSYLDFTKADFSQEVNLIINHPLIFANNILLPIATLLSEVLVCLLVLISMAFYDFTILLFVGVVLLPVSLLYKYHKSGLKKIKAALKEQYPLSVKYALQVTESLVEMKVLGRESFFKERFKTAHQQLMDAHTRDHVMQVSTSRLTEVIMAFVVCSLILFAVSAEQNYQQTILLLSIYASASFRIIPSVNRILQGSLQIRTHEYLLQAMRVLMNERPVQTSIVVPPTHFSEKMELRNISVRYPEGSFVLQNAGMVIHKGEKVALTGKSGEGKTTLLLVLLGFLKLNEGEIFVDGKKIESGQAFRRMLGYVPQNPYILDGSLAENIAFGIPTKEINREKIFQLVEDLDLNGLIDQLPDGIDTRIGERGAKLSGGQRQRLAIARALYTDADILLLDEITNQVDSMMGIEIMNLLDRLVDKKQTILMVTHTIAREDFFDTVYTLEKGRLNRVMMHA
jgi:ABC-type multidrug transport system fused ATPase/permease subunit